MIYIKHMYRVSQYKDRFCMNSFVSTVSTVQEIFNENPMSSERLNTYEN